MAFYTDQTIDGALTVAANSVTNKTVGFSFGIWVIRLIGGGAAPRLIAFGTDLSSQPNLFLNTTTTLGWLGASLPTLPNPVGSWMHIGVTVSADNVGREYVNGLPYGDPTTANWVANNGQLRLSWPNREWQGNIADFAYWTRELSAAEMWEVGGLKRRLPSWLMSGLGCYLPLMGPTGATVATSAWGTKDLSGNGLSVTSVTNAPVWADDPLPPQSWMEGPFGGARAPRLIYPPQVRPPMRMGPRLILGG